RSLRIRVLEPSTVGFSLNISQSNVSRSFAFQFRSSSSDRTFGGGGGAFGKSSSLRFLRFVRSGKSLGAILNWSMTLSKKRNRETYRLFSFCHFFQKKKKKNPYRTPT